jgi:ABC-2 type transport system permease protein
MIGWTELWRYRQVVWILAVRDLKVRYRNSILGFFWSFLNPLLQVLVYTIVFKYIMQSTEKNYSVKLFCALMPWLFFSQSLQDAAGSIAQNVSLVKKVYFPRAVLPLSTLLSNLVHFLAGMAVLFAIFLVLPVHFMWGFLWLIPLVALQMMLSYGLGLVIATASVFYNDIRYLLTTIISLGLFLSPVLYPVSKVMESAKLQEWGHWAIIAKTAYMLNPMAPILALYRSILLEGGVIPDTAIGTPFPFGFYLAVSGGVAVVALAVGLAIFRHYEWMFPEQ